MASAIYRVIQKCFRIQLTCFTSNARARVYGIFNNSVADTISVLHGESFVTTTQHDVRMQLETANRLRVEQAPALGRQGVVLQSEV